MRTILVATTVCVATLLAGTSLATAGPRGYGREPLVVRPAYRPCPLGYQADLNGRCASNSFGFGASAYPYGYSVGPFAVFAPLYGRPYRVVAVQGLSEYVVGY